ncbi:unnamed protein product [Discosporangium mesarthrocarpum]
MSSHGAPQAHTISAPGVYHGHPQPEYHPQYQHIGAPMIVAGYGATRLGSPAFDRLFCSCGCGAPQAVVAHAGQVTHDARHFGTGARGMNGSDMSLQHGYAAGQHIHPMPQAHPHLAAAATMAQRAGYIPEWSELSNVNGSFHGAPVRGMPQAFPHGPTTSQAHPMYPSIGHHVSPHSYQQAAAAAAVAAAAAAANNAGEDPSRSPKPETGASVSTPVVLGSPAQVAGWMGPSVPGATQASPGGGGGPSAVAAAVATAPGATAGSGGKVSSPGREPARPKRGHAPQPAAPAPQVASPAPQVAAPAPQVAVNTSQPEAAKSSPATGSTAIPVAGAQHASSMPNMAPGKGSAATMGPMHPTVGGMEISSPRHPGHPHVTFPQVAVAGMHRAVGVGIGAMPGMAPPMPSSMGVQPLHYASMAHQQMAMEEHLRQQEKKVQKRAANRKSAQLSRKRKKAHIEELKIENEDLQRHEDILEVVPDPVFAFNAVTGKVWFASNSAAAHFGVCLEDLKAGSFYELLTNDCCKRLMTLISNATASMPEQKSVLLKERMTVRFNKRRGTMLLGELSGRVSKEGQNITAVCSIRPLSLMFEDKLPTVRRLC